MRWFSAVSIITLLLFLTSPLAVAAKWSKLGVENSGNILYYDYEGLETGPSRIQFWVKKLYKDGTTRNKRKLTHEMIHLIVDCDAKRFKVLDAMQYSVGGTAEPIYVYGWQTPIPETTGEFLTKSACSILTSRQNVARYEALHPGPGQKPAIDLDRWKVIPNTSGSLYLDTQTITVTPDGLLVSVRMLTHNGEILAPQRQTIDCGLRQIRWSAMNLRSDDILGKALMDVVCNPNHPYPVH